VDFDAQDFADGGQLKGNHGSLTRVKQGQVGYGGDPYPGQNNFSMNANTIGHALTQMHTHNMAAIRTDNQASERILDKYANDARERGAAVSKDNREWEAAALRIQQNRIKGTKSKCSVRLSRLSQKVLAIRRIDPAESLSIRMPQTAASSPIRIPQTLTICIRTHIKQTRRLEACNACILSYYAATHA